MKLALFKRPLYRGNNTDLFFTGEKGLVCVNTSAKTSPSSKHFNFQTAIILTIGIIASFWIISPMQNNFQPSPASRCINTSLCVYLILDSEPQLRK